MGRISAEPIEPGFDGADALLRAWRDGLRPDPDLTVSAWADKHRILSPRGANEAGPWRTARTPYLREIMDALSPRHPAQRVVFMKGSQVGATESANCWIGYVIHHAPGPMLAVQPTVELAKRFSQQRVEPLIEASPILRERIAPARSPCVVVVVNCAASGRPGTISARPTTWSSSRWIGRPSTACSQR